MVLSEGFGLGSPTTRGLPPRGHAVPPAIARKCGTQSIRPVNPALMCPAEIPYAATESAKNCPRSKRKVIEYSDAFLEISGVPVGLRPLLLPSRPHSGTEDGLSGSKCGRINSSGNNLHHSLFLEYCTESAHHVDPHNHLEGRSTFSRRITKFKHDEQNRFKGQYYL